MLHLSQHIKWQQDCNGMYFILMLRKTLYISSQEIYGDNGRIYQIKVHKKMLTPNNGCVSATYELTCSDTVFDLLVMFFIYVDIHTTISFINSLMT